MSSKNKITFSEKDSLTENDFKSENIKERISILISVDVLDQIKEKAAQNGLKYQTYINQILFKHLREPSIDEKLELLAKEISSLKAS